MRRQPSRLGPIGLALVVLVVSSGCLAVLSGDGLQYAADPVSVDPQAVADAGFEHRGTDSFEYDDTVEVGGQERRIVVTSHVVTLRKRYRGVPLGHLVVLSTPRASVLGQGLNPLGVVGDEELIEDVLGRSTGGTIEDLDRTGNVSMRALGEERAVNRFDARKDEAGEVEVFLTRFEHGDDYVIVFAVVPDDAGDGEEAFESVLAGVRHEPGGS